MRGTIDNTLRRTTVTFSDGSSHDFRTRNKKDLNLQAKKRYPKLTITSYTVGEMMCDYICSLR
jgi:hypothetical protein